MKAVQTELIPAEELLKTIMNALWEGGMRPSGFKDIENEMGWQKTLQQPQERLSELARLALLQSSQGKTLAKGFDEI